MGKLRRKNPCKMISLRKEKPKVQCSDKWSILFNNANKEHFGNSLESAIVRVWHPNRIRSFFGWGGVYGIATDYGEFQEIVLCKGYGDISMYATLLHEMVHVFQAQTGNIMKHGDDFKEWREYFLTRGYKI